MSTLAGRHLVLVLPCPYAWILGYRKPVKTAPSWGCSAVGVELGLLARWLFRLVEIMFP